MKIRTPMNAAEIGKLADTYNTLRAADAVEEALQEAWN